jgi:signal transduction histidine kinase
MWQENRQMARILHIEDDPANRLLVRKLLAAKGYDVVDAADGLEGVRMACAERPDLILVDINVPHLDGYEVTLRLRGEASLAGVPIVAITAEGDRETSLAVGCDGFLQKPIDARTFAATVSGYLGGKRESTHPGQSGDRLRQQSQKIVAHLEEKVAELSAANARLREVDRARTSFYRNISHELATPMTPIVGYLKMLIDGELGPVTRSQDRAMRSMDECVGRLRALIDNLLDVTGLETGRMKFFVRDYDLGDAVRRAIEGARSAIAAHGHTLLVELPAGALPAAGDPDRLWRAVGQLLDNAIKFTPDGGKVGVRLKAIGSRYEIVVADSGPGIGPDRAEAIFEPFYQVDASPTRLHGGVGVGLAIVRRVAQGFHGDVKVVPAGTTTIGGEKLGGAAFAFTLAKRVSSPDER